MIKTTLHSIHLCSLGNKSGEVVSEALLNIFWDLEAPLLLQSDNGREFRNEFLFQLLNQHWPHSKIIDGKLRYPQSHGSVERANQSIKEF